MLETLYSGSAHLSTWHLVILLFFGTYILEDVAIVSGALLAADKMISPELAFVALLAGITSGDFLLYMFGYFSGSRPFMRKWQKSKRASSIERWLSSNLFITIFLVRFAPGLRLPCYLASGWLGVSVRKFLWAVFVAGVLWTGIVFGGLFWFGVPLWELSGVGNLFLLPFMLLLLYLLQLLLRKHVNACLEGNNDQQ